MIGGGKFLEKALGLHLLASTCDGLIFIGKLAFQTMHALGVSVPSCLIEQDAAGEALKLIKIAHNRRIPIYYPDDLWCADNHNPESLQLFPSDGIMAGFPYETQKSMIWACIGLHSFLKMEKSNDDFEVSDLPPEAPRNVAPIDGDSDENDDLQTQQAQWTAASR